MDADQPLPRAVRATLARGPAPSPVTAELTALRFGADGRRLDAQSAGPSPYGDQSDQVLTLDVDDIDDEDDAVEHVELVVAFPAGAPRSARLALVDALTGRPLAEGEVQAGAGPAVRWGRLERTSSGWRWHETRGPVAAGRPRRRGLTVAAGALICAAAAALWFTVRGADTDGAPRATSTGPSASVAGSTTSTGSTGSTGSTPSSSGSSGASSPTSSAPRGGGNTQRPGAVEGFVQIRDRAGDTLGPDLRFVSAGVQGASLVVRARFAAPIAAKDVVTVDLDVDADLRTGSRPFPCAEATLGIDFRVQITGTDDAPVLAAAGDRCNGSFDPKPVEKAAVTVEGDRLSVKIALRKLRARGASIALQVEAYAPPNSQIDYAPAQRTEPLLVPR